MNLALEAHVFFNGAYRVLEKSSSHVLKIDVYVNDHLCCLDIKPQQPIYLCVYS